MLKKKWSPYTFNNLDLPSRTPHIQFCLQSSLELLCLVQDATNLGSRSAPYYTAAVTSSSRATFSVTLLIFCSADGYLKAKCGHEYWCLCTYREKKKSKMHSIRTQDCRTSKHLKSMKRGWTRNSGNLIFQKLTFLMSFWLQSCLYVSENVDNKVKPFTHHWCLFPSNGSFQNRQKALLFGLNK